MKKADIAQKLFELSVNAGMNQRIHHSLWGKYEGKEAWLQIVLAVFAALGMIFSCVPSSVFEKSPGWGTTVYVVGILMSSASVVLAVALNVVSWSAMAANHRALFIRWSDFRAAVDSEEVRLELEDKPELNVYLRRIIELERWRETIDSTEPPIDRSIIETYERDEYQARGLKHGSLPDEAADTEALPDKALQPV